VDFLEANNMSRTIDIDLYDNYYDYDGDWTTEYPKIVSWVNPENGETRSRLLRDQNESEEFFAWFDPKYPDIAVTIK